MTTVKNGRMIKGYVQAVGPSVYDHIGREYTHITFVHEGGSIEKIPSVTAPPLVSDFLMPGSNGEFYFHTHGKRNTLLAMKDNGRKIFDISDAKRVFSNHFQKHIIMLFMTAFFILIWVVGAHDKMKDLTLMGMVLTMVGLFFSYKTRIGARYLRPKKAEKLVRDLGFN